MELRRDLKPAQAGPENAKRLRNAESEEGPDGGQRVDSYRGSIFSEVWRQVKSDAYALPVKRVTLASFFGAFHNRFLASARRTLSDPRDLLPRFNKLIRANGVCLSGRWEVTETNPYGGYFRKGSVAPLIARASVTLRETRAGQYRSFGLAGKLFPGGKAEGGPRVKTANFFVIDDNGGTLKPSFWDAQLVTEPPFSLNRSSVRFLPLFIAVTLTQRWVDSHSERRQLYPIAEAGMGQAGGQEVRVPRQMLICATPGTGRNRPPSDGADFREELRASIAQAPLLLEIRVRDSNFEPWLSIGRLIFDDCVVSDTCDHCLHFSHPRWKGAFDVGHDGAHSQDVGSGARRAFPSRRGGADPGR